MEHAGWVVWWGCEEWQTSSEKLSEQEAHSKFAEVSANPPSMGLYTADFATISNPDGEVVDSWQSRNTEA